MKNKQLKLCKKHNRRYHQGSQCRQCEADAWLAEGERANKEGQQAYEFDDMPEDNPYPEFSRLANEWDLGWDIARHRSEEYERNATKE